MHFYAIIIGTEILNGRRNDAHFEFLKKELSKYGHELFASFIIKDDVDLIRKSFALVLEDKKSVLFSFGGIGSTPDDLTREIASEVFSHAPLVTHKKFLQDIIEKFGDAAYPNRVHMADLPPDAKLLFNPVNNMSGFSLEERFFFVPGFPSMAHPMISKAIEQHFATSKPTHRYTLKAKTSEDTLISLMKKVPQNIELSSLPMFVDGKPNVELSLKSTNKEEVKYYFELFIKELETKNIEYELI